MLGWLSTPDARTSLRDVLGDADAKKLKTAFGVSTVGEFLTTFPQRYLAHGRTLDVNYEDLGATITAVVRVESVSAAPSGGQGWGSGRKQPFKFTVTDGKRSMPAAIFGHDYLRNFVKPGMMLLVLGTLGEFRGQPQLKNVDILVLNADGSLGQSTGRLAKLVDTADGLAELHRVLNRPYVPIHRGRKGIPGIVMAIYTERVLRWLPTQDDPLPKKPDELLPFDTALREVHFPGAHGPQQAIERLKYDEALELQLAMALRRQEMVQRTAPECPPMPTGSKEHLRDNLGFELTEGQKSVVDTIARDLSSTVPMNRLLQGEVGSGKTVVALLSMLQVVDNGMQCAMLAPTEVLAAQHARSIISMLADAGIDVPVTLLTGSMTVANKRQALLDIVSGSTGIVVGTHALISDGVEFFNLGLVVVDEQHRFGVRQRDKLRERGRDGMTPHVLVMTATPIPRTVAMTVFGDLDVSELSELPGGRREVKSFVVPILELPAWEARTWARMNEEVAQGNRVFIVCPKIVATEPGDESLENVQQRALQEMPTARIGVVHGQLPGQEKDRIMQDFARGNLDVLVSTTVIEVGVDVPEATVMMIRQAESFGVSQLHQLRGRVGRGTRAGLCFLCTASLPDSPERRRLDAIAATNDGFELAQLDVATRSFGDVLGDDQSGIATGLGLVDLVDDFDIIDRARDDAAALVAQSSDIARALTVDITEEEAGYLERS
ncbi:ATP-dependent DNA helicase RecG [Corynebacterium sp. H78]|uniref:ATP-dependent DNA helicase RecG n=1 Tax=Corynebacterium sp. H78 TaxID=3133417 RepID=UPI00309B8238